jgi:hypothetical protein
MMFDRGRLHLRHHIFGSSEINRGLLERLLPLFITGDRRLIILMCLIR